MLKEKTEYIRKDKLKKILLYITYAKEKLSLLDWSIHVYKELKTELDDTEKEITLAYVERVNNEDKSAYIGITKHGDKLPIKELRKCVLHEMAHIKLNEFIESQKKIMDKLLEIIKDESIRKEEKLVWDLAYSLE